MTFAECYMAMGEIAGDSRYQVELQAWADDGQGSEPRFHWHLWHAGRSMVANGRTPEEALAAMAAALKAAPTTMGDLP